MQQLRQHVRHHEIEVVGYTSDSVRVGIAFLSFERVRVDWLYLAPAFALTSLDKYNGMTYVPVSMGFHLTHRTR